MLIRFLVLCPELIHEFDQGFHSLNQKSIVHRGSDAWIRVVPSELNQPNLIRFLNKLILKTSEGLGVFSIVWSDPERNINFASVSSIDGVDVEAV